MSEHDHQPPILSTEESDALEEADEAFTPMLPQPIPFPPEYYENLPAPSKPRVKRTTYEGTPYHSLDEPSTRPVCWEPDISVLELEQTLRSFCQAHGDFLGRGLPYIESLVWDELREMPHVHIHLRIPIMTPSEATLAGVEAELEAFTENLRSFFHVDLFAVSAHLN